MVYIPKSLTKKKSSGGTTTSYLDRTATANENKLQKLLESGELERFLMYKDPSLWERIKNAGTGALDIISRPGYAAAGAVDEIVGGDPGASNQELVNAAQRVGTELFSGIGGLQGEKQFMSDVLKEKNPGYAGFAEAHPYQSMASDLAVDLVTDPLTLIPSSVFAKTTGKIPSVIGKGISKTLRAMPGGNDAVDAMRKALIPLQGFKKRGLTKGVDIFEEERNLSKGLKYTIVKEAQPMLKTMANFTPNQWKDFVKVSLGDIPSSADDMVQTAVDMHKAMMNKIGLSEAAEKGIDASKWMMQNYLHNNPKVYTDLMDRGDYVTRGFGRRLGTTPITEKGKVLREGSALLDWLGSVGITDDKLGEVMLRNINDRFNIHTSEIWKTHITRRLVDELPEVFERVPFGTKNVWDDVMKPGNTLWMPEGNIAFFRSTVGNLLPKHFFDEIIASGGKLSDSQYKMIEEAISRSTITSTSAAGITSSPMKKLEEVVSGALEARGMSKSEAAAYLNKIKSSSTSTTVTENIDPKKLAAYMNRILEMNDLISPEVEDAIRVALGGKEFVGITRNVLAYQVPKEIVEDLDRVTGAMTNQEEVWKYWDTALQYFKNTAIFSPFFHVRNTVSSTAQSYLAGMKVIDMPSRFSGSLKILNSGTSEKAEVLGKTVGWWRKQFIDNGIMEAGFTGQQVGRVGQNAIEKVFHANRALGTGIERWQRGALFIDRVVKGDTPFEAAKFVKKFHFDYGEMSQFEQKFARRIVPFWGWVRNNIPLQIEMLFEAPDKFKNIAHLKRAIAGAPESEDNPEWWQEQDVWSVKGGKWAYHMGLPYADLNNLLPGASGSGPAGMTGPAGAIYNTLANYDPFYQKQIQEFKGESVPTVAGRFLNANPKVAYFVQSMLPILKRYGNDLPDAVIGAFGDDPNNINKLKATSLILGIKVIPQVKGTQEKNKIYKLQDILRQYEQYQKQQQERGRAK